ncbi:MAG: hypothetical protein KC486_08225, partial [Myxococcales bacterium]|nr:hypothetical protein [Myxococcales bacterium]
MRDLASDDGLSADLLAWAQRRAEAIVQGIGGDVDGALDHLLSATLADWSPGPVDELGEGELGGAERELAGEAHEGENIDEVAQEAVEAEPVGVDALVDDDDAEPVGVEALVDDDDAEPVGVDALVDDDEAEPVGVEALVDDDEAAPAGAEAVVDGDAPADVDARGDDDANVEPVAELSDDEGLGLAARFARAARAAEAERAQAVVSEATQEGALLELGGAEEEAPELEVELIEPAAAEQVVAVEAELHAPVDEDEHLGPPLLPGLGDAVAEYAAVDEYVDSDAGLVEEAAATADAEDEYVDPL